jgi:hypothetical protein
MPAGAFALTVVSNDWWPIFVERMVYAGTGWTIGHAGPGVLQGATAWRFAEGHGGGFDTYFLINNTAAQAATVTLTYRDAAGTPIGTPDVLVVPAGLRGTVWANGKAGAQAFSTTVASTAAVVVERAMYWPTGQSLLHEEGPSDASVDALAPTETDTSAPLVSAPSPPSPYTLLESVAGEVTGTLIDPASLVIGKPAPGSSLSLEDAGLLDTQSSSGLSWYGSHLAVGKKP